MEVFDFEILEKLNESQLILSDFESKNLQEISNKIFGIFHDKLNVSVISSDLVKLSIIRPGNVDKLVELTNLIFGQNWTPLEKEELVESHKNQIICNLRFYNVSFRKYSLAFGYKDDETLYPCLTQKLLRFPSDKDYLFIETDDVEALKDLSASPFFNIEAEYDVDGSMMTLISAAACYGAIKCFKFLIMNNAKITEETAIEAIKGGNYEICHLLEQQKLNVTSHIYTAIQYRRYELFNWMHLKEEHEDLTECILSEGYLQVFFDLINSGEIDTNNLLITEASIHFVLASKAKVTYYDKIVSKFWMTNDADILKICIKMGGKVDFPDSEGTTAFGIAITSNNVYAARVLYSKGANPNVTDLFGSTIIENEASFGNIGSVKLLAEKFNADVSKCNVFGEACKSGNLELVKYLASLPNINLNYLSQDRMTPLLLAAESHNKTIVKFLETLPGIDLNAENSYGKRYTDF